MLVDSVIEKSSLKVLQPAHPTRGPFCIIELNLFRVTRVNKLDWVTMENSFDCALMGKECIAL